MGEDHLRKRIGRNPAPPQYNKGEDQSRAGIPMPVQGNVDQCDQTGVAPTAEQRGNGGPDHHRG